MGIRLTRREEFELCHVLSGYEGKCGRLHGHRYELEVTIESNRDIDPNENFGMLLDFNKLKEAIKNVVPDHFFLYENGDELGEDINSALDKHDTYEGSIKAIRLPFPTSAENMVAWFAEGIESYIHSEFGREDISVVCAKLWETSNSYAEYIK